MSILKRHYIGITTFLLIAVTVTAGQIAQVEPSDSERMELNSQPVFSELNALIHYGDLIEVDVVGSTEFDWRGEVTPEGVLGGLSFTEDPIHALCRSGNQVAREIERSYSKFLKDPAVRVTILDRSKRPLATLFGAVKLPQRFQLLKDVSLVELIVLSGGISENAGDQIEVLRSPAAACAGFGKEILRDEATITNEPTDDLSPVRISVKISDLLGGAPASNLGILYGDVITVQNASPVYVIGNVANPGKLAITKGLTVLRAIDAAGGVATKSKDIEIRIFRRNSLTTDIISFKVNDPNMADPNTFEVHEYDIVEVFGDGKSGSSYAPVLRLPEKDESIQYLPIRVIN